MCIFDTRHLSEDDSLTSVLNAEASVVSTCIYCMCDVHTHTVYIPIFTCMAFTVCVSGVHTPSVESMNSTLLCCTQYVQYTHEMCSMSFGAQ